MIDLVGVSKRYQVGSVTVPALDNIDLHIGDGEFVVILGASGSGKTTMLNLIGALDKPTSGTLYINGRDITDASRSELSRSDAKRSASFSRASTCFPV